MTPNSPVKNDAANTVCKARPFLKWAGGKVQLLPQFQQYYPQELREGKIETYFEPFLGGGAVFLDIAQNYYIRSAYLCDINAELILPYRVIQRDPHPLLEILEQLSQRYYDLNAEQRHALYYEIRTLYNHERRQIDYACYSPLWIERAAYMIFLNKTCYNGLFRMNRNGEFNVPYGKYKYPKILDIENVLRVSQLLQIAEIFSDDFTACEAQITDRSFVYFDPPYRPISKTSSFTSYSKSVFTDDDQVKLAEYYGRLARQTNAKLMLSNSDPTNENLEDRFFEDLYKGFHIFRVSANRMINSNAQKRGPIRELVITNYPCRVETNENIVKT